MRAVEVFLVDDHPVVKEGIRRFLEMDDRIRVVGEAESAEEAIVQVTDTTAKVVLMDITLPGMNGIEATKRLTSQSPGLRVIILSAFEDQYLMASMEAGACGYILKTATQPEMVSAVLRAAAGQSPIDPRLTGILWAGQSDRLPRPRLSGRQRQILRLVADGVPSRQIAERICVSPATLTRELRSVFDLLGVDDRAHAVAEALRGKLL